jgi:hypothetical protein
MIDVLNGYEANPQDWGTNTLLTEALASYGQITPINSLEDIQKSVADVLGDQDNPDHQRLAQGRGL